MEEKLARPRPRPRAQAADTEPLAAHAPAALRTCFRIMEAWQLSATDARLLLGTPPSSTYYKWKSGDVGSVSRDLLERVSYVLGIYKAL
ncbi:MAG: antitoxin Xre-like helix-turn-helix domain-containing protein, partial [Gemmatimonas sp.]